MGNNRTQRKEQAAEMLSLAESDRFPGNKSSYIYKYAAAPTIWIISHCFLKMASVKRKFKKKKNFCQDIPVIIFCPFVHTELSQDY